MMSRTRSSFRLEQLEPRMLLAVNILADVQLTEPNSSTPRNFVHFNGLAVFQTSKGLWQTDGTESGTVAFPWVRGAHRAMISDDVLIVESEDGVWRTNGSDAGTFSLGAGRIINSSEDTLLLGQAADSGENLVRVNVSSGETEILAENIELDRGPKLAALAGTEPVIVQRIPSEGRRSHFEVATVGDAGQLEAYDREFDFVEQLTSFDQSAFFLARYEEATIQHHGLFEVDELGLRLIEEFPPELYDREIVGGIWTNGDTLYAKIADSTRSLETYYLPAGSDQLNLLELPEDACGSRCTFHAISEREIIAADNAVWSFDPALGTAELLVSREVEGRPSVWPIAVTPDVAYLASGNDVYETDGTAAGTSLRFSLPDVDVLPTAFTVVDDRLVFSRRHNEDSELWVGDDSGEVSLLKDIDPTLQRLAISTAQQHAHPNGDFYFQIADGSGDVWVTKADTTTATRVNDLHPRLDNARLQELRDGDLHSAANGVCFNVQNLDETFSVWGTDGTAAGTHPLLESVTDVSPISLETNQERHFFRVTNEGNESLWVSQCTPDTTVRLAEVELGRSEVMELVGDLVAFAGSQKEGGTELWLSDLTAEGTRPVTDFEKDTIRIKSVKAGQSDLYFTASAEVEDVFRLDLETRVVTPIADTAPRGFQFGISVLADLGERVLMDSFDAATTQDLLLVHDTLEGTTRRLEAAIGHDVREFWVVNGRVIYVLSADSGSELWTTDGTESGTKLLWKGTEEERHHGMQVEVVGNNAWVQVDTLLKNILLRTDGTPESTVRVILDENAARPQNNSQLGLVNVGTRAIAAFSDSIVSLDDSGILSRIRITTSEESVKRIVPMLNGEGAILFVRHSDYEKIYRTDGTEEGTYLLEKLEDVRFTDEPVLTSNGEIFFRSGSSQGRTIWRAPLVATADLSGDGLLNDSDVDLLTAAINSGAQDMRFDFDANGVVDWLDRQSMIERAFETSAGDINLDGRVDFADFQILAENFRREEAGWEAGDLNGDGKVNFGDFVILADEFGADRFSTEAE